DVEVPRPPVLGVDRAVHVPARLETEADLADGVLLRDLADLAALPVGHDDLGLDELGRAGQRQQHRALHVDDLQLVRHELVVGRQQAHGLLRGALPHLAHGADLARVLVEDGVLVVDLDELGLLVHDEHRLREHRAAAGHSTGRQPSARHVLLHLLRRALDRGHVAVAARRVDLARPAVRDVLGPLGAVVPAQLEPSIRVGVPVGCVAAGVAHDRTLEQGYSTIRTRNDASASGKSMRVCAPRLSSRAVAAATSACATVARLRSSSSPSWARRATLAARASDSAERSTPASRVIDSCSCSRVTTGPSSHRTAKSSLRPAMPPSRWCTARIAPVGVGPRTPRSMASTTRGAKTMPSSRELDASRLAPCTPLHAVSPAAHSPGSDDAPSMSTTMPPHE